VSFIFQHTCCLVLLVFSCIYISQGSVATQLWCGGIFNNCFIANYPKSVRVKEFWKLANICQRYGQLQSGTFFWDTVYMHSMWRKLWFWYLHSTEILCSIIRSVSGCDTLTIVEPVVFFVVSKTMSIVTVSNMLLLFHVDLLFPTTHENANFPRSQNSSSSNMSSTMIFKLLELTDFTIYVWMLFMCQCVCEVYLYVFSVHQLLLYNAHFGSDRMNLLESVHMCSLCIIQTYPVSVCIPTVALHGRPPWMLYFYLHLHERFLM